MTPRQMRAAIEAAYSQLRDIGWPQRAAFEIAFLYVVGLMPFRGVMS